MNETKTLLSLCAVCALLLTHMIARGALGEESRTYSILNNAPVWHEDINEPPDERRARLLEIAEAVDGATSNLDERSALLTLIKHETHAARYVHLDEPRCRNGVGGRCDDGKAWGLTQLHGTDRKGTARDAMDISVRTLRFGLKRCKSWNGAFSSFATGGKCSLDMSERVETMRAYRSRL